MSVSDSGPVFLPLPSDDELDADAVAARDAFVVEHPGPLSNLDRALLASAPIFEVYRGRFAVRDEAVPYLGERAIDLFSLAISRAFGAPYPVAFFDGAVRAHGDDPAAPVVTEAEGLLLEWGTAIGAGAAAVPVELTDRVQQTFQPKVRLALTAFAGQMVAVCVFTLVGQVQPQNKR